MNSIEFWGVLWAVRNWALHPAIVSDEPVLKKIHYPKLLYPKYNDSSKLYYKLGFRNRFRILPICFFCQLYSLIYKIRSRSFSNHSCKNQRSQRPPLRFHLSIVYVKSEEILLIFWVDVAIATTWTLDLSIINTLEKLEWKMSPECFSRRYDRQSVHLREMSKF